MEVLPPALPGSLPALLFPFSVEQFPVVYSYLTQVLRFPF